MIRSTKPTLNQLNLINRAMAGEASTSLRVIPKDNKELHTLLLALHQTYYALMDKVAVSNPVILTYLADRYSHQLKECIDNSLTNCPELFNAISSAFLNRFDGYINPRLKLLGKNPIKTSTNVSKESIASDWLRSATKHRRFAENYGASSDVLSRMAASQFASTLAPSDQADAMAAAFDSVFTTKLYTPEQLATIKVATDV